MKALEMKFEPWAFAYRLFGERVHRILPHFQDLHTQMKRGGVAIALPAYISLMIFASIIAFLIPLMLLPFVIPMILGTTLLSVENIVLSLLFALVSAVLTFVVLYIYPGVKSNNRKAPMEINLPYISSFITLLSSSNVPPRKIFGSMITIPTLKEVRQDFMNMVRDVEMFGKDLLTSITENIVYIPSKKLQDLLSGYVSTIRTGGNPTQYLRIATENIMKERMIKLDMMLESLSALAEIYIMVLVAMPLLFVTLFATLGMLGGGGDMDPAFMLNLLTYVGIPIMAAILIVVIDTYNAR